MKIKELREMTIEELGTKRRELKHEMLNLRIQQQSGKRVIVLTELAKRSVSRFIDYSHAAQWKSVLKKCRLKNQPWRTNCSVLWKAALACLRAYATLNKCAISC